MAIRISQSDHVMAACPSLKAATNCTPSSELHRARKFEEFRAKYEQYVRNQLDYPPNYKVSQDPLNRWLYAQLASKTPTTEDPILRQPELATKTDVITKQLMENLPAKSYVPHAWRDDNEFIRSVARKWVGKFEQKCLNTSSRRERQNAGCLIRHARRTWLLSNVATGENLFKKFCRLKHQLQPIVDAHYRGVLSWIALYVATSAKRIIDSCDDFVSEFVDAESEVVLEPFGDGVNVRYQDDTHVITHSHFLKLRRLYRNDDQCRNFNDDLYCLLRRYKTLFGNESSSSSSYSYHAAAPPNLFQFLHATAGVTHECFASPMNCYFNIYCSAFYDTDHPFGSVGSFFQFRPSEGSYEVGPPYTEEVVLRTAEHVIDLVRTSTRALSFVVFVPDWRHPLQEGQKLLEESCVTRCHFVARPNEHAYLAGSQHVPDSTEIVPCRRRRNQIISPFATHIYVVQNELGCKKWPVGTTSSGDFRYGVLHHMRAA